MGEFGVRISAIGVKRDDRSCDQDFLVIEILLFHS